jgi:hypothetical protein
LLAWLSYIVAFKMGGPERGCAFANAATELPDPNHPARKVIEEHKRLYRQKTVELCIAAGLDDPEMLADEIFLLCEGARVSMHSVGPQGPAARLIPMLQSLVARHAPRQG